MRRSTTPTFVSLLLLIVGIAMITLIPAGCTTSAKPRVAETQPTSRSIGSRSPGVVVKGHPASVELVFIGNPQQDERIAKLTYQGEPCFWSTVVAWPAFYNLKMVPGSSTLLKSFDIQRKADDGRVFPVRQVVEVDEEARTVSAQMFLVTGFGTAKPTGVNLPRLKAIKYDDYIKMCADILRDKKEYERLMREG